MKPRAALRPVAAPPEERPALNSELPRAEILALRRLVRQATRRPAPGSSDLLAAALWRDEIAIGTRTVRVYDLTGMPSRCLKGGKSQSLVRLKAGR